MGFCKKQQKQQDEHGKYMVISQEKFVGLVKCEERIEAVRRMYESGECYYLDTALSVLGIKIRGAEKIGLTDGEETP